MGITDSHCHLYSLPDVDAAVEEARRAGVERLVVVSEDLDTSRKVIALKREFPDTVFAGVGIHPVDLLSLTDVEWDETLEQLESLLAEADLMGEIGLDFKFAETPESRGLQKRRLLDQFALADKHALPVNLHSRRALRATMEEGILFHEKTGLPVLLHWFAHSKKLIRRTNEAGLFVSVGPTILSLEEALDVALTISPDYLLVETDTPVPYGGESSRPAWAARVAQRLCTARDDVTPARLEENAARYLSRELF